MQESSSRLLNCFIAKGVINLYFFKTSSNKRIESKRIKNVAYSYLQIGQ